MQPRQRAARRWVRWMATIVTVVLALAWARPAEGTDYLVRTSGDDGHDGLSAATALRTIAEALDRAEAGDTIYVGAGTYAEEVQIGKSGLSAAYLSILADTTGAKTGDAGQVVLDGGGSRDHGFELEGRAYVRIEGFGIRSTRRAGIRAEDGNHLVFKDCVLRDGSDNGIEIETCEAVTIDDCQIHSNSGDGISVDDGIDVTVRNCEVYENSEDGVDMTGGQCAVTGCAVYDNDRVGILMAETGSGGVIASCLVYGNQKEGIRVTDGEVSIYNCMVYDNKHDGIFLDGNGVNATMYNNTVADNGQYGVHVKKGTATLRNNLVAYNGQWGLRTQAGGSMDNDYNLLWQNSHGDYKHVAPGGNDVVDDPHFADHANHDYHLTDPSAAVDAGTAVVAPLDDFEGQDRPVDDEAVDIGADELGLPARTIRILLWRDVAR